jgi:hypothetical protein
MQLWHDFTNSISRQPVDSGELRLKFNTFLIKLKTIMRVLPQVSSLTKMFCPSPVWISDELNWKPRPASTRWVDSSVREPDLSLDYCQSPARICGWLVTPQTNFIPSKVPKWWNRFSAIWLPFYCHGTGSLSVRQPKLQHISHGFHVEGGNCRITLRNLFIFKQIKII